MATTYIDFDPQTAIGRKLSRSLQMIREARDVLRDALATMATMVDGDGSDASHFTILTSEAGYPSNAVAKSSWNELQSLSYIINRPGGQGDAAGAAITQACAKHGV